ncbi:MAG: hypothetical protein FJ054_07905 [Cyanobacteria bacterium M_surface_10_m2_119]|nr:hypothetical protein [Cyanobacteria bacterium M_surface_10_m2_119]
MPEEEESSEDNSAEDSPEFDAQNEGNDGNTNSDLETPIEAEPEGDNAFSFLSLDNSENSQDAIPPDHAPAVADLVEQLLRPTSNTTSTDASESCDSSESQTDQPSELEGAADIATTVTDYLDQHGLSTDDYNTLRQEVEQVMNTESSSFSEYTSEEEATSIEIFDIPADAIPATDDHQVDIDTHSDGSTSDYQ